jgi:hypothetical protein
MDVSLGEIRAKHNMILGQSRRPGSAGTRLRGTLGSGLADVKTAAFPQPAN